MHLALGMRDENYIGLAKVVHFVTSYVMFLL